MFITPRGDVPALRQEGNVYRCRDATSPPSVRRAGWSRYAGYKNLLSSVWFRSFYGRAQYACTSGSFALPEIASVRILSAALSD